MKVYQLIDKLREYNMKAEIDAIAHNQSYPFTISFGSSEGVTKSNADIVSMYVDDLCNSENIK